MRRPTSYLFAIVVLATTAPLATSGRPAYRSSKSEARFAADGAFRDGLYMGSFAAEHSQPPHPGVGRWSTLQDRSMFTAGYQRGYDAVESGTRTNPDRVTAQ
jgi:hypothetical protein